MASGGGTGRCLGGSGSGRCGGCGGGRLCSGCARCGQSNSQDLWIGVSRDLLVWS